VVRQLPEPKQLLTSLGGDFSALLQPLLGATLSFFGLVGTLVIAIVVSIYWSIGREYFERFWLSLLPVDIRGEGRTIWREIAADLGGYLRSEFVQGYSAAVLLGLAYWLLGQPYPVLLAVVGGLAWLLPWVGLLIAVLAVSLASLPALLFDVGAEGLLSLAGAVLATIGVLVFLELLLEPRLYDRRRFNPLLEVLVVVASFSALGVGGLLLGPPLAAAIQVCASHLLYPRSPKPVTPPPPSVLKRRLESLKATVATLEHPPPEYQSLISRLEILLDEAEPILQVLPPDREPTAQIV
jgi:predicted PurR-regulated permease PerM